MEESPDECAHGPVVLVIEPSQSALVAATKCIEPGGFAVDAGRDDLVPRTEERQHVVSKCVIGLFAE